MAADILLYDAEVVPVGKDQVQHLQITRDVATKFNNDMGETFVIPNAKLSIDGDVIPGIDGHKMSKSRNNFINIFTTDKELRKQIMRIVTDTKTLEEHKDAKSCNVFAIYKLIASDEEIANMKSNYENGNYGYGQAKQELFNLICDKFKVIREKYDYYMNNLSEIDMHLNSGADKAKSIADLTLSRVRNKLGY